MQFDMKTKTILIILVLSCCFYPVFSQSYSVKTIHQKVDSTIRADIGNSLSVEYRMWVAMINYQYREGVFGKIKTKNWKTRNVNDTTKGNFCGAKLSYHIYFRDKHNVGWKSFGLPIDTICVDSDFNLTTPLKARRIPEYILKDDTTKFLNYQQVCQLIKEQFPVDRNIEEVRDHYLERTLVPYLELFQEPIIRYETDLLFERNTLRYRWIVTQIIRCGIVAGYIESIEEKYMKEYGHLYETKDLKRRFCIDAITGEIMCKGYFESCAYDY